MLYVFRPAEKDEAKAVFELVKKRVQWMDETGIRQWNVTGYLDAYPLSYYEQQQAKGRLYVLLSDSAVIGGVVLLEEDERWSDRAGDPALYVHNLVTDPFVKGAGRQLLTETEHLTAQQKKRFVRLDCAVDNAFLNQYYESQGYHLAGFCEEGFYKGNRREKEITP